MVEKVGIIGYDYVEFYVGSAKMWAYWYAKAMGLNIIGYCGPETDAKDKVSYLLSLNNINIVISSAIKPNNYEIASFVEKHGDGVNR